MAPLSKRKWNLESIRDFNNLPRDIKTILYHSSSDGSVWIGWGKVNCTLLWLYKIEKRGEEEGGIIYAGCELIDKNNKHVD